MRKILLLTIGTISVVIGGIGILIPILPTTPFLLIAGSCYATSSDRLYKKLLKTKHFGVLIQNYKEKTGVPKKVKIHSIIFLWTVLIISAIVFRKPLIWCILGAVGIVVSLHIAFLRKKIVILEPPPFKDKIG